MSIEISQTKHIFKLDTVHTSYVMRVEEATGYLGHAYYGAKIRDLEACGQLVGYYIGVSFSPQREGLDMVYSPNLTMQECSTNEIGDFRISSIALQNPDGTTCVDPRFVSAEILPGKPFHAGLPQARVNDDASVETLKVTLEDPFSKVVFHLFYTVFPKEDVIVRSMQVVNRNAKSVYLKRAMSCCLDFPRPDFDLVQESGTYFRERWEERNPVHSGVQGIFSKRSSSGHNHTPAFALASSGATESAGEVYGGILVYSGSFAIEIEKDPYDRMRLAAGINPENFSWKLTSGESFQTPEIFLTFSSQGLGGMTRNFHDMLRDHLIDPRFAHAERPILINNWEATYFNFNREKILSIAKDAAELGIEMFVLDDGWFGHRDNDTNSLGDWFVNEKKIGSLKTLVGEINALGLKFGLWFEPEMISEESELFKAHPEWVFTVPGRPRSEARHQFMLNFALPEVVDFVFDRMSKVLQSANIAYIKWDMNRQPAEKFLPGYPEDRQLEAGHRFVLGVYELHRRITGAFPNLFIEGCSGGGGRFDAGILYYAPQIWTSDDTDAIERLRIQSGTSRFYPCSAQGAHVSVCPNHGTGRTTPFRTRGNVAMAGTFGYELDLNKLTDEERAIVKEQVAMFRKYHHLVTNGNYYRLIDYAHDQFNAAWEFAAKDASEAILIYVQPQGYVFRGALYVRLKGLVPEARYAVEGTQNVFYGDTLMNAGIQITPDFSDGYSSLLHVVRVN